VTVLSSFFFVTPHFSISFEIDQTSQDLKKLVKMSEGEEKGLKTFSLEEVAEHNIAKGEDKSIWTVIHDRVYDVTKFTDEVSLVS
jgi:cytochrome b involved in lipid metabolism